MSEKGNILMQKYEMGKLLGKGSFAKVYHARCVKTSHSVAIKVIDKDQILKCGLMDQISREISVMKLVKHPNIVQLYEVMATKTKIYFVLEYVKGGELFNKVRRGRLKEDVARKYFQQLISAVDFCHSRGVYHRDLKPENLLLDGSRDLKISDFGLSALPDCKRQDGLLHTSCGTPAYVAPEVISRKGYDGAKADIWACGVILYVLLAGYLPFQDKNLIDMYKKIFKAELKWPSWFSSDARKLLRRLLHPNPSARISIAEIMEHPWFRSGLDGRLFDYTMDTTDNVMPVDMNSALDYLNTNTVEDKKEAKFTSTNTALTIVTKLEEIATSLRLKVTKKGGGLLKMVGSKPGRKGVMSINAEIFHVTPNFHLVEIKKTNGDTVEYQKVMKQCIRPALKDIVWAWQGEQPEKEKQQS
ncbi:unnamed protein product [Urochloa decumbens]|uniref:non-specific serine/threonine protein kinase n=2 Tax=Urochloa decumbens TaxID=240449 RepID=A0ABC8WRE6_9POAL